MSRNYYLRLFALIMVLVLSMISCQRRVTIVLPFDTEEEIPNTAPEEETGNLLPNDGSSAYGGGYVIGMNDTPAMPIDGPSAVVNHVKYPQSAYSEGIEGLVMLSIHLLSDGSIAEIKSLDDYVDSRLLSASIDAVLSVEWSPAIQNGVATDSYITVPIRFKLDN